jgi:hypothetical protein
MSQRSYKSVNEIKVLLIDVLSGFEFHLLHNRDAIHSIVNQVQQMSVEFCKDLSNGTLVGADQLGEGGNGVVSNLYERYSAEGYKQFWVSFNSFNPQAGWVTGYARVVLKKGKRQLNLNTHYDGNTLYTPEFIHESIVQAFLTNLYNSSVTPHIVNLYASYLCNGVGYNLIEKADTSLGALIRRENYDLLHELFTMQNLVCWTTQIAWTAYVMKLHYNIVHLDLHLGNLLLTDISRPDNAFVFSGINVPTAHWYKYTLDQEGNCIYLPVTKYFLRIADYGYSECRVPITSTVSLTLKNNSKNQVFQYATLSQHPELFNSLEVNYVIRNFCITLHKMVHLWDFFRLNTVLNQYVDFAKKIDPSLNYTSHLFNIYPTDIVLENQQVTPYKPLTTQPGLNNTIIRYRAWGTPNQSIQQSLYNILRAIPTIGIEGFEETNQNLSKTIFLAHRPFQEGDIVLECNSQPPNYEQTYVSQYIKAMTSYYDCDHLARINRLTEGQALTKCAPEATNLETHDINLYAKPSLTSNTVKPDISDLVDHANGELKNNISESVMKEYRTGPGNTYQVTFQPALMGTEFKSKLSYKPYQLNTLRVAPANVGQPVEQVSLHLIYMSEPTGITVLREDQRRSLLEEYKLLKGSRDICNGGYFIVKGNLDNKLTKFLKKRDLGAPLGYNYDGNVATNTLPIPLPYEPFFTVVVQLLPDGKLDVLPYSAFVDEHELEGVDMMYQSEYKGTYFVVSQRQIRVDANGKPILKKGSRLLVGGKLGYSSAFCTGPLLIEPSRGVVFSENLMVNGTIVLDPNTATFSKTKSSIDQVRQRFKLAADQDVELNPMRNSNILGFRYKTVHTQDSYSLFLSNPGESNFLYGMRHSNVAQIHSALCHHRATGRWMVVMAEGRGYYAPGIDRHQFAWLLSHFDIDIAASLDGGFSANAIQKIDPAGTPQILLYSPDAQRKLSSMITFLSG